MAQATPIRLLVYETVNRLVNVGKPTARLRIPFAGTWTVAVEFSVNVGLTDSKPYTYFGEFWW